MTTEPAIGDVLLDRYELVEEIGRGGFGVVYRAKQLGMNRDVAVKLLHKTGDEEMRERFKREAMMARNLNHPHTIRQYDFGETEDGLLYLVLEYLEGVNMVEAIQRDGALGDDRVRHIAEGVLKSLGEAHAQGIVHRDLKPANIMICRVFGESDYPKVLDFGIAKTVHGNTDLTQAGVALGSPKYMAPEILQGVQPTPAADVYSVAITLSEAIIGAPLLNVGNSVEAAQLQLSPKPLPVPDDLKASALYPWLSIALKKNVAERYQDAAEMLDHLHAPAETLMARGADVDLANISASDTDAPTGRFDPAPNIDPHGETMTGTADNIGAVSMETLPQDGFDAKDIVGNADQFAKTEAFQAVVGPDGDAANGVHTTLGAADETAEGISTGHYDDDEAPTEMISLDEFEQQFGHAPTAEANPALVPTAEANPALSAGADESPSEARTQVNPAIETAETSPPQQEQGEQDRHPSAFQSSPPGGMGMMPGIGRNADTNAPSTDGDEDRTEFVNLDSIGPTVSPDEQKTQKTLFVALGGLVFVGILAIVGLAAFLLFIRGDKSADVAPSPETPVATATSEKVEVKIYAKPKVSAVIIDGQEKTKTPARFRIEKSELPKKVSLKHPGYKTKTITITADGKNVFDVQLESSIKMNDDGAVTGDGPAEPKEPETNVEPSEKKKKSGSTRKRRKKRTDKPKNDDNVVPLFE